VKKRATKAEAPPEGYRLKALQLTQSLAGNILIVLVGLVISRALYLLLEALAGPVLLSALPQFDSFSLQCLLTAAAVFVTVMILWCVVPRILGIAIPEFLQVLILGAVIVLRPWIDGITYPERNTLFTFLVTLGFAFWSVRLLLEYERLRYPRHVALLAAFVLIALVLGQASVQYSETYRALLNWTTYFMAFTLAANALRDRRSVYMLLGLFVLVSAVETVWAMLHVSYIMPIMREAAKDPTLLARYFNVTEMTEEIRSRISSNRATGSFLHANTLACWTLATIPFAAGAAVHAVLRRRAIAGETDGEPDKSLGPLFFALVLSVSLFLLHGVAFVLTLGVVRPGEAWSGHPILFAVFCVIIPIAIGVYGFFATRKNRLNKLILDVQCLVLPPFVLMQLVGLAKTYSRGGMLATAAALALGAAILWYARHQRPHGLAHAAKTVAGILLAVAVSAIVAGLPPSVFAANNPPEHAAQPPDSAADLEGVDPSFDAMMDPSTAMLRLSYWKSGINMVFANPITGVGLGNFGTVYPKYQVPHTADVKQAHNDYLQIACETGFVGAAAFIAFWGYFVWWGILRILREPDPVYRWLIAGLFCGIAGILFHAVVDMDFVNPSLATLALLMAGLFLSLCAEDKGEVGSNRQTMIAGGVFLLAAAVSAGACLRLYQLDALLGTKPQKKMRLEVADTLLGAPEAPATQPLLIADNFVALLIPDRQIRESFGRLYAPVTPTSTEGRPVGPGEPIPQRTRLLIPDGRKARAVGIEQIHAFIERVKNADAWFPYDPETSTYLFQLYDVLYNNEYDEEELLRLSNACLEWAEVCVARSPEQVTYRVLLANVLWRRGEIEPTAKQLEYYDRSIEEYERAIERYPIRGDLRIDYGKHCITYGQERLNAGDKAGGQALIDKGNAAIERGTELLTSREVTGE